MAHDLSVQEQRENNGGGVTGKGFLPGRSGNPGGRPKGRSLTSILRDAVARDTGDGRTVGEALMDRLLEIASKGDRQAIVDIVNRLDGKPVATVNVTSGPVVRVYDVSCAPDLALEDSANGAE